jgi:hypothetical protein
MAEFQLELIFLSVKNWGFKSWLSGHGLDTYNTI